jgi:hypothetical protein
MTSKRLAARRSWLADCGVKGKKPKTGVGPEHFGPPVAAVYPPVFVAGWVMGRERTGLPPARCVPWPHPTTATGQCQAINGIESRNSQ